MRLLSISFALGTVLLQMQPALPPVSLWWLVAPALAMAAAFFRPQRRALRILVRISAAVLCLFCGFLWAAWFATQRLNDQLPLAIEGTDVRIVGVIAELPQPYERSLRFTFDVEQVLGPQTVVPSHIGLSWWGTPPREGRPGGLPELHAGERWEMTVRLRRPHGLQNPGGFDYEAWLLERNIRATGYVRAPATARRLTATVWRPGYLVERLREIVRARIVDALPQAEYAGVLTALAVGDQRGIPPSQWQVFTRTGVNHLISISGLHVTMISGLIFWLMQWLWSRNARCMLWLPSRKAAAAVGLMAALAYAWLSGFAIPAQRTVYMLAVVAVALWRGRITAPGGVLCAALWLVVILDPWSALSAGFWLSFGAVGVIMFVSCYRIGPVHWLVAWGRVQWAVTAGLMPVLIALFQQVSLISPLANAFAIPVVSLAVVPLTLFGVIAPGSVVLNCAHGLMAAVGWGLQWLSEFPVAVWQQHAPPVWTVVVALAGIVWLLLPRGFPARWIGAFAFLPMFLIVPVTLPEGSLRLTLLDVGQGLAAVLQTRSHALLFDAGTTYGPQADSGNRVIVPFLRASGIRVLDTLVVSHADKDHAGGVDAVLQSVPVGRLLQSQETAVARPPTVAERCIAGDRWHWDGVDFEVLHPSPRHGASGKLRSNDLSCVLRASVPGASILFAADMERKTEAELVRHAAEKLPSRILLAPHHGSRTSSSAEFLAQVSPEYALFAAGYRNRFGHPKDDVLDRYRERGSRIYRTDLDGAITVTAGPGDDINVRRYRASVRKYWHAPLENPDLPDEDDY